MARNKKIPPTRFKMTSVEWVKDLFGICSVAHNAQTDMPTMVTLSRILSGEYTGDFVVFSYDRSSNAGDRLIVWTPEMVIDTICFGNSNLFKPTAAPDLVQNLVNGEGNSSLSLIGFRLGDDERFYYQAISFPTGHRSEAFLWVEDRQKVLDAAEAKRISNEQAKLFKTEMESYWGDKHPIREDLLGPLTA